MARLLALFHRSLTRRAERLARRVAPHVPRGATLLDIGSGTGHNARAFRLATGGECLEMDVVDFHVVGPGPILFDGSRIPLADGAVDVCLLAFVLNYSPDPVSLLREAGRVTSGPLLLLQSTCEIPRSWVVYRARNWLQGRFAFGLCRFLGLVPPARLPSQHLKPISRQQLKAIVAEAGLIVGQIEPEIGFASISRDLVIVDHPRVCAGPLAFSSCVRFRDHPDPKRGDVDRGDGSIRPGGEGNL